jgi:hypothetical protein
MITRALHRVTSASQPWVLAALALGGCDGGGGEGSEDGTPTCVSRDASACTPLYEPTWARVYAETIVPRCGTAGGACHAEPSAAGAGGGLVVSDMAATHAALLDGFVVPGDAACSEVVVRLDVDDARRMPPGAEPLPEGERCAVARWIADGAAP